MDLNAEAAPAQAVVTPPQQKATSRKFWGPWMGLLLTGAIILLYFAIQVGVTAAWGLMLALIAGGLDDETLQRKLEAISGLLISVATLIANPICIVLTSALTRASDWATAWHRLGFRLVTASELMFWLGALLIFLLASGSLIIALGRPVVPEFMREAYRTAEFTPLLWIGLVVLAPLFEEVLFRGFLFRALEGSRLGAPGAVIIPSILWSAIHLQYDYFDLALIFCIGILLGCARARTGSILPCLAMHAAINLLATQNAAALAST